MKNIVAELETVQNISLKSSGIIDAQECIVKIQNAITQLESIKSKTERLDVVGLNNGEFTVFQKDETRKGIYQEPVKVKTEPNLPERIFNGDLYAVIVKSESIGNRLKDLNTVKYGLSQLKRQLIEEDGERLDWQYKQMINELVGWETFREEVCNIRKP